MDNILVNLDVDIAEPKQTMNLGSLDIFYMLTEKYKVGGHGKEYNLITSYANRINDAILAGKESIEYPIIIKYPNIRMEWISAVVAYKRYGKVKIEFSKLVVEKCYDDSI